jgi:L-lactate dehydrogenase (cytochrome)
MGATACSFGKGFLFALSAGGQKGVEMVLQRMRDEIRRDMILMGCKSIKDLNPSKIIYR